jgi:prevent-host-death family protein
VESPVWTVAQAKAKLSEVIEHAQKHGPQAITRNGRRTAVIVSAEEWERKTQRSGSLADFFAASRHGVALCEPFANSRAMTIR